MSGMTIMRSSAGPIHVDSVSNNKNLVDGLKFTDTYFTTGVLAASRIYYMPIWLKFHWTAKRMFHINGSTSNSSNINIGMYDSDGARMFETGAFARSGTLVTQYSSLTDSSGGPGFYYFAFICASATPNFYKSTTVDRVRGYGCLYEDSSGTTLPSTMTPAAGSQISVYVGFTQSESV